jgi:hypothetical protein
MIRLRITQGETTNTEYFVSEYGKASDTMKLQKGRSGSYAILRSEEAITLDLNCFYSTDPKIKGRLLEKAGRTASVKGLTVIQVIRLSFLLYNVLTIYMFHLQAETPPHLCG